MWPFDELGLPPTSDIRQIKRAYAKRLKVTRPDDDPAAFERLHDAYRAALDRAKGVAPAAAPWLGLEALLHSQVDRDENRPPDPPTDAVVQTAPDISPTGSVDTRTPVRYEIDVDEPDAEIDAPGLVAFTMPPQTTEEASGSPQVIRTLSETLDQETSESVEYSTDQKLMQVPLRRSDAEIVSEILHFAATRSASELQAWLGGHPALWSLRRKEAIRVELWRVLLAAPVALEPENIDVLFSAFQLDGDGKAESLQQALHVRCRLLLNTVMRADLPDATARAAAALEFVVKTGLKPRELSRALCFFLRPRRRYPHIPPLDPPFRHVEIAAHILTRLDYSDPRDHVVAERLAYWNQVADRGACFWKLQARQFGMATVACTVLALFLGNFSVYVPYWNVVLRAFIFFFSLAVILMCSSHLWNYLVRGTTLGLKL